MSNPLAFNKTGSKPGIIDFNSAVNLPTSTEAASTIYNLNLGADFQSLRNMNAYELLNQRTGTSLFNLETHTPLPNT